MAGGGLKFDSLRSSIETAEIVDSPVMDFLSIVAHNLAGLKVGCYLLYDMRCLLCWIEYEGHGLG